MGLGAPSGALARGSAPGAGGGGFIWTFTPLAPLGPGRVAAGVRRTSRRLPHQLCN